LDLENLEHLIHSAAAIKNFTYIFQVYTLYEFHKKNFI